MLALVSGLLSGCAQQTAVLELFVDLPPAPPDRGYAFAQVRRSSFSFESTWLGEDPPPVALDATERTGDHLSVVVDEDELDLHVRVRLCQTPGCSALEDDITAAPQACAVLEQPVYLGERTRYTLVVDDFSTETCVPERIDKCQVEGCGISDSGTFCRSDGTHLCE